MFQGFQSELFDGNGNKLADVILMIESTSTPTIGELVLHCLNQILDRRRAVEQEILRRAGGHNCEYVWSDLLNAHIRIG